MNYSFTSGFFQLYVSKFILSVLQNCYCCQVVKHLPSEKTIKVPLTLSQWLNITMTYLICLLNLIYLINNSMTYLILFNTFLRVPEIIDGISSFTFSTFKTSLYLFLIGTSLDVSFTICNAVTSISHLANNLHASASLPSSARCKYLSPYLSMACKELVLYRKKA